MPKQQMVFAARAAGIMPLGFIASVAGFGDWDAFGRMVRRSRQFGFMGAGCIHPGQVPIVNREYSPSPDEVAYARRIVEEKRQARGSRPRLVVARRQDDRRSRRMCARSACSRGMRPSRRARRRSRSV
jgi:citrate lyase subunit beta/citryl-CoA lyase